ncbi:hypothetical protein Tco_1234844 [Tanacetum coccineum]
MKIVLVGASKLPTEPRASKKTSEAPRHKIRQNILWTQQGQMAVLYSHSCIIATHRHDLGAYSDNLSLALEIMLCFSQPELDTIMVMEINTIPPTLVAPSVRPTNKEEMDVKERPPPIIPSNKYLNITSNNQAPSVMLMNIEMQTVDKAFVSKLLTIRTPYEEENEGIKIARCRDTVELFERRRV